MRQIGTLPAATNPKTLGDYLLSQGVTTRAVESGQGWAIWVHNEDQLAQAREAFEAFERDPDDPRFADAGRAAEAARREQERLDRQYRKNVRELSGTLGGLAVRRRPLTLALVLACVAVYVMVRPLDQNAFRLLDTMMFFPAALLNQPHDTSHGLDAITHGQVWRLVTPAFVHLRFYHILFNLWALLSVGTLIESRRGTAALAAMVLVSAVVSNVTQYLFVVNFNETLVPWFGISGVVFALFGYIWMKGQVEPEQGMRLDPLSVRVMLFWLILGFAGLMNMANGAHLGGLVVGMLFGLARF